MTKLFDQHCHTNASPDGRDDIAAMACEAAASGLAGFVTTDHCEADAYYRDGYDARLLRSAQAAHAAAQSHPELYIGFGVELGQPLHDTTASETILTQFAAAHPFDFVLASLHNLKDDIDFCFIDYRERGNAYDLLEAYFAGLFDIAAWNRADIMAHLTYPLRYICGLHKLDIDIARFDDVIDEIFKTLIQNGKGIEINCAELRRSQLGFSPNERLVARYRELGGEIITIGSDAHSARDLGSGLEQAAAMLKQCGFKYYSLFKNRTPQMIAL